LRGDDALFCGELFGCGHVGDAEVCFAGLEVLDCEGGVAEDLEDGFVRVGMVGGWGWGDEPS
jgi:hypothetical protein